MENIDVIFYINLAHRTDRRVHIEKQLEAIYVEPSKVIRIDAVKRDPGALGCTLSHMKAYETFLANPAWKTCMILEDDFTFHAPKEFNDRLTKLMTAVPHWDVIQLAFNPLNFLGRVTDFPDIVKVMSAQTTSGYCVTRDFVYKLHDNFRMAAALMEIHGAQGFCSCDITWKALQSEAEWYTFIPSIGYQMESYSDVMNGHVNYRC